MQKSKRILVAKNTLEILKQGHYETQEGQKIDIEQQQKNAVKQTRLYKPNDLLELIQQQPVSAGSYKTKFEVNGMTTMDAVRQEYEQDPKLVCLNFASAKNPGGGFLNGAQAQEESIARVTGLYPCQLKTERYYQANRNGKTCLYTDHIIYSPDVPIIKDEAGELLDEPVYAAIITAPAVNTGVVLRQEPRNIDQIEPVMKRRMEMVLAICLANGHKTLVLGAWGCGVFQNDPKVVAGMFKELLFGKYKNQFARVVFAIYARDDRFIRPFQKQFG